MAKAGYVGNQPVRESQAESYPGAWTGQEQYQEIKAGNWSRVIYNVERSVRLNSADGAFLDRTATVAGNRKTWTWSGWVKKSKNASAGSQSIFGATPDNYVNNYTWLRFSGDFLYINHTDGSGGSRYTTSVYRDTSAWMHIVVALDTTQAVAADRLKLYVNGVMPPYTGADPGFNEDWWINYNCPHYINAIAAPGATYGQQLGNQYIANVHFIDGLALTPSAFATTDPDTNQWVPKKYANSHGYGTNGFWLKFADNSAATAAALGKDSSPNGNNWTPNNLSVTAGAGNDSLTDTPTSYGVDTGLGGEVRGNYCTWNPLEDYATAYVTLSNGNLWVQSTQSFSSPGGTISTATSGKWYWEVSIPVVAAGGAAVVGFKRPGVKATDYPGANLGSYGYRSTAIKQENNNAGVSYGATWATSAIIGVAIDADAGTATFYKNGVSQGVAFTGLSGNFTPHVGGLNSVDNLTFALNAGQRPFVYTAPSGFKALCDTNLPAPVVAQPSTVMDVKLYTGNGSTQTISGLGFSPDLVWTKSRANAYSHLLYDTVRGATNYLTSNNIDAEGTGATTLTAFNSDGFTLGSGDNSNQFGGSVAWCWDAGSSTVTNTQGSITSSVRANASAGFSIVTYTGNGTGGATVGHGLGVAPQFVIIKRRSLASNWIVGHSSMGWLSAFEGLNTTDAFRTADAKYWNNTSPTSAVITLGNEGNLNGASQTFVAYCFAPVAGYSAFGSYTSNNSSNGPFVYLGFRPAFVLIKCSTGVESWVIYDSKRGAYNFNGYHLLAQSSDSEPVSNSESFAIDMLSNGFKVRGQWGGINDTNTTDQYIYAAFAESPFQYARAR